MCYNYQLINAHTPIHKQTDNCLQLNAAEAAAVLGVSAMVGGWLVGWFEKWQQRMSRWLLLMPLV